MGYPENDVRLKFTGGPWDIGALGKDDGMPELDRERMAERFRTSLMMGVDGNKCYLVTAMIDGESVTIGYMGNGPTSKENAQLISYVPELVMRIDELEASLALSTKEVDRLQDNEVVIADERFEMERTLNAKITELEQQVATLEEYMLKGVAFRDELQAKLAAALPRIAELEAQLCRAREALNIGPDDNHTAAGIKAKAALSSCSPCPHEEEAKRLREALDAACDWIAVRNREKANGFRLSAKEG